MICSLKNTKVSFRKLGFEAYFMNNHNYGMNHPY